ncbi:MAG: DEAD/DEAH box helicase, partial [Gammaproteobacteria bacterium]
PPLPGGEYLDAGVLAGVWRGLDNWVREAAGASGDGFDAWLERNAAAFYGIGRVAFHLAENRLDPELPFAFLATYAPRLGPGGRVLYKPLGNALEAFAGEKNRAALARLLRPVHAASGSCAWVKSLLDSGDVFHPLAWTQAQAYRFLTDLPALESSGLVVRVPDWWRRRPRPRVSVTIGARSTGAFGADAMLDFKVGYALGDEALTRAEVAELLKSDEGLVRLKGRWVELDKARLDQALEHWRKVERDAASGGLSFAEGMRLLAGAPADLRDEGTAGETTRQWSEVIAGRWLTDQLERLRDPRTRGLDKVGLRGRLRPYQAAGRDWLWLLCGLGLGACLADDMGLGKTVQIIALLLAHKARGTPAARPSLLVLPTSLLANWKSEIERFAPTLEVVFVHPSELDKAAFERLSKSPVAGLEGADLVITTYGMLSRQPWLGEQSWHLAILDEAQAIKNPGARQTRAVKRLHAHARIALTGTPVENRLSDLWSLFDFINPGLLGSAKRFAAFAKSLENRTNDRYAPLRVLVQPYILRRLKTDRRIISDLPDKTEMQAYCGLTPTQAALYQRTVDELRAGLEGREGIERRGLVLASLMRFKQICNHPSQVLGDGEFAPAKSGKFERLRELCEEIGSRQERPLVFTQFREMTDPLAGFLAEVFGREGAVLHGGTAVRRRKSLVDSFQREDGPPFMVLSLKAGGVGLNLTAASHVIHFDRWWNPAVEAQATDRAYRIGQHRNVMVHKFICRGTVEERIDELIAEKAGLAQDLLEHGAEQGLTEMSDAELLATVALDVDSARL